MLAWCDPSTQGNCARLSRRRCGWVLYAEVGDLNPLSLGTLHLTSRPVRLSCKVLACKRQCCAQGAVKMSKVERLVLFCLFSPRGFVTCRALPRRTLPHLAKQGR